MSGRPVYEISTLFPNADMAELVDAPDLKSVEYCTRAGSIPAVGIPNSQTVKELRRIKRQ